MSLLINRGDGKTVGEGYVLNASNVCGRTFSRLDVPRTVRFGPSARSVPSAGYSLRPDGMGASRAA